MNESNNDCTDDDFSFPPSGSVSEEKPPAISTGMNRKIGSSRRPTNQTRGKKGNKESSSRANGADVMNPKDKSCDNNSVNGRIDGNIIFHGRIGGRDGRYNNSVNGRNSNGGNNAARRRNGEDAPPDGNGRNTNGGTNAARRRNGEEAPLDGNGGPSDGNMNGRSSSGGPTAAGNRNGNDDYKYDNGRPNNGGSGDANGGKGNNGYGGARPKTIGKGTNGGMKPNTSNNNKNNSKNGNNRKKQSNGNNNEMSYANAVTHYDWKTVQSKKRKFERVSPKPTFRLKGIAATRNRDIYLQGVRVADGSNDEDIIESVRSYCLEHGIKPIYITLIPVKFDCTRTGCRLTVKEDDYEQALCNDFWPDHISARVWTPKPRDNQNNDEGPARQHSDNED